MARADRQAILLAAVTALGVSAAATVPAAQAAPAPARAASLTSRAAATKGPNPSPTDNQLNGVSADSATDAWAVGFYLNSTRASRPLILHWDGTAWSQM